MQKTSFPTEVIIHDDASTDGTADIIREYEQKYPEIFKPIYQTENQYSKGISIFRTYIFPQIQGKYVALCEGDDYWTDEYKLQKQVDFLKANEDFSICFHPVKVFKQDEGIFIENIIPEVPEVTDIKTLATKNYINTPSVIYRVDKKVLEDINNFPVLPVGDYLFHMLFAKNGKIKKLPDSMAVYRIHNSSGWSTKPFDYTYPIWLKLLEALLNYYSKDIEIYNILKEQYYRVIDELIIISKNEIQILKNEIQALKRSKSYRLGKLLLTPLRILKSIKR
jgi:glycosyltransferase involved in cell wall biosynthesis